MNPEHPKKPRDVAAKLEEWSALVELLEKYGPAYTLGLPFKLTALRRIMIHAEDWFDEWQQGFYSTPDGLTPETYQKLYAKCEDWARKKKLYDDTKNSDAMDLSNVNGTEGGNDQSNAAWNSWNVGGWVDEDGNF